jgi:hypothetical protein
MDQEKQLEEIPSYESGAWRDDHHTTRRKEARRLPQQDPFEITDHNPRELTRLIHLLGLINYKILTGTKVYVEVGGIVYKTLYGCYWRSVYTGVEHYLLRCQEISSGMWTEGSTAIGLTDLPINHTKEGWTARGHSILFMLNRD